MANYKVLYTSDGIEKKELLYKGVAFDFSMIPDKFGKTSNKKAFDYQVAEHFQNEDEGTLEALSELGFADENEIRNILLLLEENEQLEVVKEEKKTNADWSCQECNHEWKVDNPFITPGDCPRCGSDFIQHY